ncbi:MAG: hypothetical protein AB1638_13155 [Nitrospirota bacterium]
MKRLSAYILISAMFVVLTWYVATLAEALQGTVIKIKKHPPINLIKNPPDDRFISSQTIRLRTKEEGDIDIHITDWVWKYSKINIEIGDVVSVPSTIRYGSSDIFGVRSPIERIRTVAEEKAKAQLPEAITYAKLGKTKEAIDIYLSIPEEEFTPNNISLWN